MQRHQVGDELKKGFQVTEVIPGGMGIIYIAEIASPKGPPLKRAFKSCDIERGLAPDFRQKIESESLLWISLRPHPGVVRAFSFEFDGGLPLLMIDYMPGGNLRARIGNGPMQVPECLRIAVEFCDGMTFLTDENRILHLDIKPENVLFDENDHVKITDFGLARAYEDASSSAFREIAGTLPYMSPEQLSGNATLDTLADVYAFGVMLYEMLSGRRPFTASDAPGYEKAIAEAGIAPLPEDVPQPLRELVKSCLHRDRSRRVSRFSDLSLRLSTICEEMGLRFHGENNHTDSEGKDALDSADWNNRGYAFVQSGQIDEALRCYQRGLSALAAEPRSENYVITPGVDKKTNSTDSMYATLLTNMGALLMRIGRVAEAKEAFNAALAVVPDDGGAYLRLGQIALHEGQVTEGLALLKKSTECEPGNFDLLLKYIRACLEIGDEKTAEQSFEEFLAGKRNDPPFLVGVGCLLDDEFGLSTALRCFDTVLEFDEDFAPAWYNKGVALQRAGENQLAIESYRNAIRLDRHHPFARCYLGIVLIRSGNHEEGLNHLKRFLQVARPSPLTEVIDMALQGSQFGLPLDQMLEFFGHPQAIKHAV